MIVRKIVLIPINIDGLIDVDVQKKTNQKHISHVNQKPPDKKKNKKFD